MTIENAAIETLAPVWRAAWRGRYLALAGAIVAAGFAYWSASLPSTYRAKAVLAVNTAAGGPATNGTIVFLPPQNVGGVQLTVPSSTPISGEPLGANALKYLVTTPSVANPLVKRLAEQTGGSEISPATLTQAISMNQVEGTALMEVIAVLPSSALAISAANVVAEAVIEQDRRKSENDVQTVLHRLEAQLSVLRGEKASGNIPTAEGVPSQQRMEEVMYLERVGLYKQALAQRAIGYQRLDIIERAMVAEEIPPPPRRRVVVVAFFVGGLMALTLSIAFGLWASERAARMQVAKTRQEPRPASIA